MSSKSFLRGLSYHAGAGVGEGVRVALATATLTACTVGYMAAVDAYEEGKIPNPFKKKK